MKLIERIVILNVEMKKKKDQIAKLQEEIQAMHKEIHRIHTVARSGSLRNLVKR